MHLIQGLTCEESMQFLWHFYICGKQKPFTSIIVMQHIALYNVIHSFATELQLHHWLIIDFSRL
jgi:hypothetical protein